MRAFVSLGLGGLAALTLAPHPGHAQGRDSVAVAAPFHVSGLDPSSNGYIYQRMGVGETLVETDVDGNLVPGLATEWTQSDDGLTWRFPIRQGVRFHNGSALDAEAAAGALNRALEKPGILSAVPVADITADGDAVVVRLDAPFSALPAVMANYATLILAPAAYADDGEVTAFHATGPFTVTEVAPPLSLQTARFEEYWGDPAQIAQASYLSSHRPETRALMAESGDADLAVTLDPAGYDRLSQLDGMTVEVVSIPRTIMLKLNAARPALAEPEAREALSMAIDREGIAAGILGFPNAVASQLFPPVLGDWHDDGLDPLGYDPEAASAMLADLGWEEGPDGTLTRDGAPFALTLRTFPNRPELPLIAAAIQDQWRQIGVDLSVSVGNSSEIPAGHQDGSLDIGLMARNYGLTPDPIVNAIDDFAGGGGDWGAMNWENATVAEALTTAVEATDAGVRDAAVDTVVETLQTQLPVIPIAWYQHTVAYPDGLENVVVDPLERTYGLSQVRWAE